MKKMNKMYEAPVAEMIEMKTVTVLMESPAGETPDPMPSTES
jgi:hypothetical protein